MLAGILLWKDHNRKLQRPDGNRGGAAHTWSELFTVLNLFQFQLNICFPGLLRQLILLQTRGSRRLLDDCCYTLAAEQNLRVCSLCADLGLKSCKNLTHFTDWKICANTALKKLMDRAGKQCGFWMNDSSHGRTTTFIHEHVSHQHSSIETAELKLEVTVTAFVIPLISVDLNDVL